MTTLTQTAHGAPRTGHPASRTGESSPRSHTTEGPGDAADVVRGRPFLSVLWIDIETFCEVPIKRGTYVYAESAEILTVQYAIGDGPVRVLDLTADEIFPDDLVQALRAPTMQIRSHNAMFERAVFLMAPHDFRILREAAQDVERWYCTAVQALAHSLPAGLDRLCEILGVAQDEAKLKTGKDLIRLFCVPQPKNYKLRRATRTTHPGQWRAFLDYAASDITAMRSVSKKLPTWNFANGSIELARWHMDQRRNDRGFLIDMPLAEAAIEAVKDAKDDLDGRTLAWTGGLVERSSKGAALLGHIDECYGAMLAEHGIRVESLRADVLRTVVEDQNLPGPVRELLQIRLVSSKSSTAKYTAVARGVNVDGRLRGAVQFNGASRTGRPTGRVFQPLNLPRPPKHLKRHVDEFIGLVKLGGAGMVYDDVIGLASAAIRGLVIAPPGRQLVVCDLSQIESRMLAWLAGEEWKLEAFRQYDAGTGPDLYVLTYHKAYGASLADIKADEEAGGIMRQVGKVMDLSLGFQGGPNAFASMAKIYGVTMPEEARIVTVKAYRKSVPSIAHLWYDAEDCARRAIAQPGTTHPAGRTDRLVFERWRGWLMVHLPSGRRLCYASPKADAEGKVSYMGIDQYTKQWKRIDTYGGKFAENATQAAARDAFWQHALEIEAAGFDPLFDVYDEFVSEADEGRTANELVHLITQSLPWAPDLPVASKGFTATRYRKD